MREGEPTPFGQVYGRWLKKLKRQPVQTGVVLTLLILLLLVGGSAVYAIYGGAGTQSSSSDIDLQKGLVGWWKMNGNGKDSTPNAEDATVTNATLTTDRKGAANSAYSFNGTTACLNQTVGSNSPLKITGAVSIAAWFYSNSANNSQRIVRMGVGTDEYYGVAFNGGTTNLSFAWYDGAFKSVASNSGTVSGSTWHHVVVTRDGSNNVVIYLDGSQIKTGAATTPTGSPTVFDIGATICGTNEHFSGFIDDVRVYNRALSANEASALAKEYDAQLNAASGESSLIGWWKLDGNLKDSSPNASDLTNHSATTTTDRKGASTTAYAFASGSSQYASTSVNSSSVLNPGTSNWSISAWIKSNTSGTNQGIAGTWSGSDAYWYVRKDSTNKILLRFQNTGGGLSASYLSTGTISDTNWHHIAISIVRSGNATFYIDGSASGTADVSAFSAQNLVNSSSEFNIGNIGNHLAGFYFDGSLDDVRLYKRAISATEVTNLYKSYNSQVSANYLSKGLVGDWAFNGNAKDATPYADNGTISSATLTTDRKGRSNSAYSFNGSASISYGAPSSLNTGSSITVCAWFYPTSNASYQPIVSKVPATYLTGWEMANSSGAYRVTLRGPDLNYSTGSVSLSTWHFLCFTYSPTTLNLYIDGSVQTPQTGSVTLNTAAAMMVGGRESDSAKFNGSIDDVRIWNRALSSAEISQLYRIYR